MKFEFKFNWQAIKKKQRVFCKGQLCEQKVSSLATRQELSSRWIPAGRLVDKKNNFKKNEQYRNEWMR